MSDGPEHQRFEVGGHADGHGTRLAGKAVLVTGGGCSGDLLGTGAATAILMARHGPGLPAPGSAAPTTGK